MANWTYTVRGVRKLFEDNRDLEVIKTDADRMRFIGIANQFVECLRTCPVFREEENADLLTDLVEAAKDGDLVQFNDLVNEVYDIADARRVWID